VSKLPFCLGTYVPKPSYDPTNKNYIIISANCNEKKTTPAIFKYNLVTKESQIIYKYNQTFKPSYHGQFINTLNNTLILYGGISHIFKIFDLNTNQIKQINDKNIISKCGCNTQNTFIPSPMNEIHTLDYKCNHYKFNITNKETIKMETNSQLKLDNIKYPKLLYIKSHKKLYVFGSHANNKIFSYNNNKWNINKLHMPYWETWYYFDILNGFDNILVVFYFKKKQIFILNLLNMKWYKSQYYIPDDFKCSYMNCYVMKMNNNIHIIDFKNNIHSKVNIFDIIPRDIIIYYRKHFQVLIMGYLRENENKFSLQSIPHVLKILMLNYFPLFE